MEIYSLILTFINNTEQRELEERQTYFGYPV
jgi:hypothetical protein